MRKILIAALFVAACAEVRTPAPSPTPEERAQAVLQAVPLVDGHNDWAMSLRGSYGLDGALKADLNSTTSSGHTSIPLLKKGKVGIQLWSVYVSSSLSPQDAVRETFEQIAIADSFATRYPETFAHVKTADEAIAVWKSGRIAGLLALEGAHQIDDNIELLRKAYVAGVRSMTLSHGKPTKLFDSATAPAVHNGMAPAGAAMIAEMNRLGMLVDLSHVSPATMHAVLDVSRSPIIFSHSSAYGLAAHPRNVPDDVLKRMAANGGIVMITFVPGFIDSARPKWQEARSYQPVEARAAWEKANPMPITALSHVADHVEYVARIAGHDHVGLGGDYDGVPDLPQGLADVGTYPALFAELAKRGWSDENLRKLAGKNFIRVLRQNEKVAAGSR